ncbi:hypothetical protein B0J15DRAFT_477054 [Fusarium solani]|uniref:Uncharacterized protein n=1 Tax=Fusarium solani TaxID=169388 RepID=A0A9P9RBY6_FUSSL|nr:uncharacterized protein B0J15DRAFT_477054 [Fusarium solani]KAH7273397.1 hypothetical protein B0J15DRAFT_477054 [Fusarium solani]
MTALSTEAIVAIVALPIGLSLSTLAIYTAYLQLGDSRRNHDQGDVESVPLANYPEAMAAGSTWPGLVMPGKTSFRRSTSSSIRDVPLGTQS